MLLYTFYFLAAISIALGLLSLRGGVRFVRYLQKEFAQEPPDYSPFATVFVPCRGVDDGLKENILSLFEQDYPAFEVIFVSDSANDAAFAVIEEARQTYDYATGPVIQTIVAGPAIDSGQKVHNLRAAIAAADVRSSVFVFTDTDARPPEFWLRFLIAPLSDYDVGAATGYRWFVPVKNGLAAHLQSVWNAAIASALGKDTKKNFCWGGATAIRRETFAQLQITERWRGTLSDDFTVTRVVCDAKLPIKFVPQCLTPSYIDTGARELLEFTTRQLKITRVYAAHLWRSVLIGSAIFSLAFFAGLALVIARAALGLTFATPLMLLLLIFALGAVKSHLRLRAVAMIIYDARMKSLAMTIAHVTLWPLASLLFLFNALAAAVSRRINWRGITYELKSPTETVILPRDNMNRSAIRWMIPVSLLALGVSLPAVAQRSARPDRLRSLVDAERAFSRASEEKGIREAFTAFIADDGILFRPRAVKGKEWMQQHPLPASKTRPLLRWQPVVAAISRAGDLGYTTGPWQYQNDIKDKKPSAFGDFMTIWKQQLDGSWKFVLDLGVSHPPPKTQALTWQPRESGQSNLFRRINIEATRAQLLSLEKEFSDASARRGAVEAFLARADKDVRLYRENREVFVGKKTAATGLTPLAIQWTWTPEFADVSISGDLGYSYGSYELREQSSGRIIESGNYARVWKKERGVWKVVIDVTNPVPPGQ